MQHRAPCSTATRQPVEALAGTIERVTFHSPETGLCVLKVQARGKRDLVPIIGYAPAIGAGEWITATGTWHTDRQHGLQFKADTLKVTPRPGLPASRSTSPRATCAASARPWPSASSQPSARTPSRSSRPSPPA